MADPYVDPATGVLRNRLGITDAGELGRVEAEVVAAAELVLYRERPVTGRYDLAHLQAIHRHLFGEVYEWAGELRTVDIAKGGTYFARVQHIEAEAHRVFNTLAAQEYLRGLDRQAFAAGAGRLLGDLNALHPFRDGNGRAQRGFLQLLARDAGWQLAWARVDPAENARRSATAMAEPDALVPLVETILSPVGEALPAESLLLPRLQAGPGLADSPVPGVGLRSARAAAQLAAQDRTAPARAQTGPGPGAGRSSPARKAVAAEQYAPHDKARRRPR